MSPNEETKTKLVFVLTGNNQSSIAGEWLRILKTQRDFQKQTKGVCEIFENKNQTRGE